MNIETIKLDPRIARIHYADYRKRCAEHRAKRREEMQRRANELEGEARRVHIARTRIEREDQELLKAYRALYRGQQIIDLPRTIRGGGLDDKKLPKLAICQADKEKCHLLVSNGRLYMLHEDRWSAYAIKRHDGFRFESAQMATELTAETWRNQNSFPNRAVALVPSVPPHLRPSDLSKYFILWEAEWTAKAPVDPLLLSRINDTMFAIVAQWDLTPLEQRILEGRL
jgi:hypothetical protein